MIVEILDAANRDLVEFPRAYPLVEQFASQGVRRRRHGRYLIFFVVEPERIAVIRILHASRDHPVILDT